MTEKPVFIVDMVGEIVAALPAYVPEYLPNGDHQGRIKKTLLQILQDSHPEIQGIFYDYGYGPEIVEELRQRDEAQTTFEKKYPLIILFFEFEETINNQVGRYAASPVRIAIVNQTEAELKTSTRYDLNFKPVLYPIYQAFIELLESSGKFIWNNGVVEHRKVDLPYWNASQAANGGNDFLDAIEIRGLQLNIYSQIC